MYSYMDSLPVFIKNLLTTARAAINAHPYVAVLAAVIVVVLVLRAKESFEDSANDGKRTIVLYYAPWCGHCKNLKPKWEKVAEKYKNDGTVTFKKVNCDDNPEEAQKMGIEGYPTIILFSSGKKHVYDGDHTEEGIEGFLQSN